MRSAWPSALSRRSSAWPRAGRPAGRLLGPARGRAETGFRVDGGFAGLVARPALALARLADRLDRGIDAGVRAAGRGALALAGTVDGLDARDHAGGSRASAGLRLALAGAARRGDERGIDGLIAALVRGTGPRPGRASRPAWSTGSWPWPAGGAAVLLALLLAGGLLFGP